MFYRICPKVVDTSVPPTIIHLPFPPSPPHAYISRSMCLSCCLWCVCSLIWLDSSCAAREPSWFPVWPAADWWGCYICLFLSGSGLIICRFSLFFLLHGLSASLCFLSGSRKLHLKSVMFFLFHLIYSMLSQFTIEEYNMAGKKNGCTLCLLWSKYIFSYFCYFIIIFFTI